MLDAPPTNPPASPGCYIFRDAKKRPIYVGKAKNLKARVAHYFQQNVPLKIRHLRRHAHDLEYIVTASEWEAFLLENNLIKQFKPRFNVLLKDDKTYPYLKLTVKDTYPRAQITRRPSRDGSLYYGPFVPGWQAKKNLRILQEHFRVVTCKDPLDGSRPRPCLYYEMGQCYAPCIRNRVAPGFYAKAVEEARLFLEGHTDALRKKLTTRMREASAGQEYELAGHYRDLARATQALGKQQSVVRPGEGRWDLFALYGSGEAFVMVSFIVLDGKVVDRRRWRVTDAELPPEELFAGLLARVYGNTPLIPDGVAVSRPFDDMKHVSRFLSERKGRKVPVIFPQRGPRARLMALVLDNARLEFASQVDPGLVFQPLVEALELPAPPRQMECFDISHHHGEATSASCVVWESGKMVRSRYRHFNIKTVEGVDDFASMAEAVGRRYTRLQKEGDPLPGLIVIDGGAGQVNAAYEALRIILPAPPPVVGLAKREERLFLPHRSDPLVLGKESPALHELMKMRDEAHRFAIRQHRRRKSKKRTTSPLLAVPGIGPATARKLLKAFMTTQAVKTASQEELERAAGKAAARRIRSWIESGEES
ncbi:MAG: excinuclease ABC subunit UvrC [Acidobacteriota bacterium]